MADPFAQTLGTVTADRVITVARLRALVELLNMPEAEATPLLDELEAAGYVASATGPLQ
jgi:DNA-binding IclR family transcriptional regulator